MIAIGSKFLSLSGVSALEVGKNTGLESLSSPFLVKLSINLGFYLEGISEPEVNTLKGVLFSVEFYESL